MAKIIPSIFVFSKKKFQKQFDSLKKEVNLFQIDIVDGKFVIAKNNIQPSFLQNEKNKVELHLMVKQPLVYLKKWTSVKNVKRILVHAEIIEENNFVEIINFCKKQKWELGLVLNPNTKISKIKKYLKNIDVLVFMGVLPGKQGQKFDNKVLRKIKNFKKQNLNILVSVDGGVKEYNIQKIISAGADNLCVGSAILDADDPKTAYRTFTQLTKK
ncbi:MAG: hypothetical protein WC414_02265 [Patescibacteria group bacterium]